MGNLPSMHNVPTEFVIDGVPATANPFDPRQADLQLVLTDPNSATIKVDGFWYQAFSAGGSQAMDQGGWRARFTPTMSGKWQARAHLQPANLSSNELDFAVAESANAGFVRVDPAHPHYFAYDNGERFLPIGVNMGWWNVDAIQDYTKWLDHFAAESGNTIRLWMADWAFGIEWNDTGLGDYSKRMRQAWLLDEIMRLAGERGIKVILVLNHHGQFSQSVNPEWDQNPYNVKLGGLLDAPEDFVSNAEAIAYFQQRMRYIIARWGADPNLLAWDWWNEYNFTPISDVEMRPWLAKTDDFLDEHDINHHLTTLSGPAGPTSAVWQEPGTDVVSVHVYTDQDPLQFVPDLSAQYDAAVPDKPLLLEEFGYSTSEESADSNDKTGIHLHNGLWATLFSGLGASGMYWWWDSYIEPLNLWTHFGAITRFLAGIDVAQFIPAPATVTASPGREVAAVGLLMQGDG
jgi:hypothetical protein